MIANRLIVEERLHDRFVQRLVERAEALAVGDPSDPGTDLGPLINNTQLETIQDKLARARHQGAQQLARGEPAGPAGLTLPAHVLLGTNEIATAREEVFGPVITVRLHRIPDALDYSGLARAARGMICPRTGGAG